MVAGMPGNLHGQYDSTGVQTQDSGDPSQVMQSVNQKVTQGLQTFGHNVETAYNNQVAAAKNGIDKLNNDPKTKKVMDDVSIGLVAGGSAAVLSSAAVGIAYAASHMHGTTTSTTTSVMTTTTFTTIDVNATIREEVRFRVEEKLRENDLRPVIFWLTLVLFIVLGILICLCAYSSVKSMQEKELGSRESRDAETLTETSDSELGVPADRYRDSDRESRDTDTLTETSDSKLGVPADRCMSSREIKEFREPLPYDEFDEGIE
jgi:hypothetical protein